MAIYVKITLETNHPFCECISKNEACSNKIIIKNK